jgi:hypothetical protein
VVAGVARGRQAFLAEDAERTLDIDDEPCPGCVEVTVIDPPGKAGRPALRMIANPQRTSWSSITRRGGEASTRVAKRAGPSMSRTMRVVSPLTPKRTPKTSGALCAPAGPAAMARTSQESAARGTPADEARGGEGRDERRRRRCEAKGGCRPSGRGPPHRRRRHRKRSFIHARPAARSAATAFHPASPILPALPRLFPACRPQTRQMAPLGRWGDDRGRTDAIEGQGTADPDSSSCPRIIASRSSPRNHRSEDHAPIISMIIAL